MKFRGKAEETETREEVREMAEALSLFGSAMRHVAERRSEHPSAQARPVERPAKSLRLRLALAPAMAAAVAIAVALPAWSHFHQEHATTAKKAAPALQESNTVTRASVNDSVLMNQIDTDVSQEVPDALQPLAQLGEQAAANNTTVLEKKNGTQE
jgi:hypothetical protein